MPQASDLPFVDEHRRTVAASSRVTWDALLHVLAGMGDSSPRPVGALLGTDPRRPSGPRPFAVGSEVPGFRVTVADPGERLLLEGGHRFSRYRLEFLLDPDPTRGTVLRARTNAAFPGPHGTVYRALVIGTRLHVLATTRILTGTATRAERTPPVPAGPEPGRGAGSRETQCS